MIDTEDITLMHTQRLRPLIALLVAIHYLALVAAVPFLHRHSGLNRALERTSVRQATPACAPAHGDTCPACQWDQLSKAPASATLAWTLVERVVARAACLPAESLSSLPLCLPSSRAPPSLAS